MENPRRLELARHRTGTVSDNEAGTRVCTTRPHGPSTCTRAVLPYSLGSRPPRWSAWLGAPLRPAALRSAWYGCHPRSGRPAARGLPRPDASIPLRVTVQCERTPRASLQAAIGSPTSAPHRLAEPSVPRSPLSKNTRRDATPFRLVLHRTTTSTRNTRIAITAQRIPQLRTLQDVVLLSVPRLLGL